MKPSQQSFGSIQPGPQQIMVPDLGALKQPPPNQLPAKTTMDIEIRWAGLSESASAYEYMDNVAIGHDAGLGMIVIERQGSAYEGQAGAMLIPPAAVRFIKVRNHNPDVTWDSEAAQ
jgi:hypothetical protein